MSRHLRPPETLTPPLPSPFPPIPTLSPTDLQSTAYEIFVASTRSASSKPLAFTPSPEKRKSVTSTTASRMKKALGMRSKGGGGGEGKGSRTVGEMVRLQMGIAEEADGRVRKGLLRVAAGQLGRRIESMVLPLELLQQFKASDFPDRQEYETWQSRHLKILEAGLLLHPHAPLNKSDAAAQRFRQILRGASDKPLETGKNSESMQILRSAVMALASRSVEGYGSDTCHWADGLPLNLHLYQMLLEACFENSEEGSIIEEVDEVLELIKKTWGILGIDQVLHNICFVWTIFHRYVVTGQKDHDLLFAADDQLGEVIKDAKATKDTVYSKILSSTLSSILGWAEKHLLAYHDTFNGDNIESMECVVSLGVSAAKVLVEDISHEYRRKRREEVDVARDRVETYIRSSLRTAFAQKMEQADSSRRSRNKKSPPVLSILAKDIADLANKEKDTFSPILKKWHPLAAGVAAATLHACYRNELKQFISGITELTPDSVQVLKDADKLEKDLVQVAVEESVDSEDGGKAIIREMPPYEAEYTVANLARKWIKTKVDKVNEWIDRKLQQEAWIPKENKENIATSVVEVLRIMDETLDAFFALPIPTHPALLPDLVTGLDRSLQQYIAKAKTGCGTRNTFVPALPGLTRCATESKFYGVWKKKEKSPSFQKMKSQVGTMNGGGSFSLQQLCVRMNTLHHIRTELENLEKRMVTSLRNVESAHSDATVGLNMSFELSLAACQEGIQQLCEAAAYKLIFHDLSHVFYDNLYVGGTDTSRIDPLLKELDPNLETVSQTVHPRVRNRLITTVMKASFDAFLLVLLAGGSSRAFSRHDSQALEEDFKSLKDLYLADGDGLPEELVEKAAIQVRGILPLFRTDTDSLIDRYKRMIIEAFGAAAKSKLPMPPTTGHWNPTEANTILRVLCHRNEETASKFLKKTYSLPKKI